MLLISGVLIYQSYIYNNNNNCFLQIQIQNLPNGPLRPEEKAYMF
jgi:hypothetical protein